MDDICAYLVLHICSVKTEKVHSGTSIKWTLYNLLILIKIYCYKFSKLHLLVNGLKHTRRDCPLYGGSFKSNLAV